MSDSLYYDDLEIQDPEQRQQSLFSRLPEFISHARLNAPAYTSLFSNLDTREVVCRQTLAKLPLTRKSELSALQQKQLPFGGFGVRKIGDYQKVYSSPGPIYEPESSRLDYWRTARALYACGFRKGQLVHNTYSYHLSPAGSMLESGAFAIGCAVIPGGVGQTELQVKTIADLRPDGYVGTPSFLRILLEKADELALDISCIKRASVSGEALPEALRDQLIARNIHVLQSYATADVGLIAYETSYKDGLVLSEDVILEIVKPGSGDPVAPGDVGEVVVTVLNPDYPMIRFATGDMSALMDTPSACGRTNQRIKGWMGRADQTTKVKGMFIRPEQVNAVADRFPEVERYRMVVTNPDNVDNLCFQCELTHPDESVLDKITQAIKDLCKLRASVEAVSEGTIGNDGKIISDERSYE